LSLITKTRIRGLDAFTFWWKDIVKLVNNFKEISSAFVQDGSSILIWQDLWNGHLLQHEFPELFSFARNPNITIKAFAASPQITGNFHLPFSDEAHNQFLMLQALLENIELTSRRDTWTYIWGNSNFSSAKAYKKLIGHRRVHPAFHWIWRSKCQMNIKSYPGCCSWIGSPPKIS
jgi:hypothetical protein